MSYAWHVGTFSESRVNKLSESEDIISINYGVNFYESENKFTFPIQIILNFYIKCWFIDHNIMLNEFLLNAGENISFR